MRWQVRDASRVASLVCSNASLRGGYGGRRPPGVVITDVIRQLELPETDVITLDTPELKPFRAAPTSIVVLVTQDGRLVKEAAIAEALKQCGSGRNVLFCSTTVFDVRVLEKAARASGVTVTVAHSKMGDTEPFMEALKNSRRNEQALREDGDIVTAHQLYAISPICPSGVSSRSLIDVVVASVQGSTVSAKILMQMVQRARDANTEVILVVTDPSILRLPGGEWVHERVDFNAASPEVQKHCRARTLTNVATIKDAYKVLHSADLGRAFGGDLHPTLSGDLQRAIDPAAAPRPRLLPGIVRVGIAPEDVRNITVDDDAFYAHVGRDIDPVITAIYAYVGEEQDGPPRELTWVRLSRRPYPALPTLAQMIKEVSRKERLSQAAIESGYGGRFNDLLHHLNAVKFNKECLLKLVQAHVAIDDKTQRPKFLRTLEAIIRREERQYTRPQLLILNEEQMSVVRHIQVRAGGP